MKGETVDLGKAAQPVDVGDNWPYGVGIYGPANMPAPSPVEAWLTTDAAGRRMLMDAKKYPSKPFADAVALTQPRPTGEPAGEVAWIDHTLSGVVLRTLGECKRLEDLPHGTKLYALPHSAGVPGGEVGR